MVVVAKCGEVRSARRQIAASLRKRSASHARPATARADLGLRLHSQAGAASQQSAFSSGPASVPDRQTLSPARARRGQLAGYPHFSPGPRPGGIPRYNGHHPASARPRAAPQDRRSRHGGPGRRTWSQISPVGERVHMLIQLRPGRTWDSTAGPEQPACSQSTAQAQPRSWADRPRVRHGPGAGSPQGIHSSVPGPGPGTSVALSATARRQPQARAAPQGQRNGHGGPGGRA